MSSRGPGAGRERAARTGEREFSAGGVLVRGREVAVIVPTRRAADGSRVLALPKGHADGSETPIEAAAREVREETGLTGSPVCELGESRYWYRRDGRTIGKTVAFYLFEYEGGDVVRPRRRGRGGALGRPGGGAAEPHHDGERKVVDARHRLPRQRPIACCPRCRS